MIESCENLLSDFLVIKNKAVFFSLCKNLKNYIDRDLLIQESGNCTLEEILSLEGKDIPEDQLLDSVEMVFKTIPHLTRYRLVSSERGATFHKIK